MKKNVRNALAIIFWGMATAVQGQTYDIYSDTWVCVDGLGREVPTAGNGVERTSVDTTVNVGMYYYIWHGQHGPAVKDNTKLLEKNAENPEWGGVSQFHWGGKPLLGYYNGGDAFVIARHMQMLVNAGVDFYFIDVTNGYTYDNNVRAVMNEADRRRKLGLKVPGLAFIVPHQGSAKTVKHLYDAFYKNPANDVYWYKWEGKPLILGNEEEFSKMDKEVRDVFTIRHSWAWETGEKRWSWLEHTPQQPACLETGDGERFPEQISVATAQHVHFKIGKSYHNGHEPSYDARGLCRETPYGLYFDEQWKQALKVHPKVVMLTQWNEWMAQRFEIKQDFEMDFVRPGAKARKGETYFIDVYNQEFCRDIEPSSEPLIRDNYYLQMVSNIRRYRGVRQLPLPGASKTIRMRGSFEQWNDVVPEYRDEPGDCSLVSADIQQPVTLERRTNDIVKAKVAEDRKNLYFYVAVDGDIVPAKNGKDAYWMTLLVNSDGDYSNGWNGYDYIVANNGRDMVLSRYDGEKTGWTAVGKVKWRCGNREMMLAVPRKMLGSRSGTIDFKWIDNISKSTRDILDFYVNGDAAPDGRFNYRFCGNGR